MTTRTLIFVAATLEALTGLALLVLPEFVAHLLFGTVLSNSGVAVGRVCGAALISLAVACWPQAPDKTRQAIVALLIDDAFASAFVAWLAGSGQFKGLLLWPAVALHGVLTILLAVSVSRSGRQRVA